MITKNKSTLIACLALTALGAHAADEAPPSPTLATAALASNCFTCHGPRGRSPGDMPSLNTLSAADLAAAVKQFRSGERASTVMGRLAKGYSDTDIDAIAGYIAGLNAAGGAR